MSDLNQGGSHQKSLGVIATNILRDVESLVPMVTAKIEECEKLRAQLPEEMQDCTIVFMECRLGHGWLTAMNWVQHPCPTCVRNSHIEFLCSLVEHHTDYAADAKSLLSPTASGMSRQKQEITIRYHEERAARITAHLQRLNGEKNGLPST